jgi:predicted MFS family arabinose efflux permease
MRARIGIALGAYWGGIAYAIDVIALISALGAIGGLPALLSALTGYTRRTKRWLQTVQLRSRGSTVSRHVQ